MSEPLSCSHPEVHVDTLWQENARLRAELQVWQQRFGDAQATLLSRP